MAPFYNAVIKKDINSEVIARAFISNTTKLPPTWALRYGGKRVNAGTFQAMELIRFCSATKPVHVFLRGNDILVKTLTGKNLTFYLENGVNTTTKQLQEAINEREGIPPDQQRIIFAGRQLEDDETLLECGAQMGCTFHLVLRLRGGGDPAWGRSGGGVPACSGSGGAVPACGGSGGGGSAFPVSRLNLSTVDLESSQIKRKGVRGNKKWLTYDRGLNLEGTCSNKDCISNKKGNGGKVVREMGFGLVTLTPFDNKFTCSACNSGRFTPSNFFVSMGRALFRFKKSGPREEVREVLMESVTGSIEDYKEFNTKQKGKSSYDLIEIRTVREDGSPYYCASCGVEIWYKSSEILSKCGHAHHQSCYSKGKNCSVCTAPVWKENDIISWMDKMV